MTNTEFNSHPINPSQRKEDDLGLCDSLEQFIELEQEFGIAVRWIVPRNPMFAFDYESRWRWTPKDGLGWPKHGNDVM